MSASPTSPRSSEVAADQPKDTSALPEPLSDAQPKSQDANHGDPAAPPSPERGSKASPNDSSSSSSSSSTTSSQSRESGEASPVAEESTAAVAAPPLPNEPPPPATEDDGWDFHWDATSQAYFFHNRFTNETTWENPRLANNKNSVSAADPTSRAQAAAVAVAVAEPPKNERPPAGGYNPAIHGDYDPNAWYARQGEGYEGSGGLDQQIGMVDPYAAIGTFNRFTGRWQGGEQNPDNHNDEAKSRRQMNAFFDVDAAANSHDGRSLKAERAGKKPTKAELKQFKEKRRARKEEKRRAWLRD
ncbi:uncharacterized protein F4812DRAFT_462396 [Daldinia caldariorum]|uniref:uncharacterized protein n=1 Tax=Daldinia caldariorum TaxID=326644 RepID=UPI0020072E54|nr:uncharacterized protein F4812DRAFT_462396 [Daldinia caldariorum]KAI1464684.1 hypothetical protein F4812DRAFT_462396 [Daldinia caldariorum]